ncbi:MULTISPECIES: hypothetical protein [unclassified Streptomyces]|uniref:hypothetical protein n=1 Tax=unclassified Streptomyces TaxID=2593676 RepID=UPI00278BBD36|nr:MULTISPECIES: hypothetical protein [unclassified Streptomyces]
MSDDEREALAAEGEQSIAEQGRQANDERHAEHAERPVTGKSRHDGSGWSLY